MQLRRPLRSKKGYSVQDMLPLAIAFVVVTIAVSLGATVLSDIQDTQTADETDYNVTGEGLEALETFGEWLPTIALVVVIAVIIGIIIVYLARRFM